MVATPSTSTLPGVADIEGPRTLRASPDTSEYAPLKIRNALANGTWKYCFGPVSRSIATILDAACLPMPTRMRTYRDHGRRGSVEIEEAGCGELAILFALYHPGPAPSGIDQERWKVLLDADG